MLKHAEHTYAVGVCFSLPFFLSLFSLHSLMVSKQAVTKETAVSADRSGVLTYSASPTLTSSVVIRETGSSP